MNNHLSDNDPCVYCFICKAPIYINLGTWATLSRQHNYCQKLSCQQEMLMRKLKNDDYSK